MSWRAASAIQILVLVVQAQNARPAPEARWGVTGVVRDGVTGQPIANVYVTLTPGRGISFPPQPTDLDFRTGADGRFAIPVPKPGFYVLYALADGYASGSDATKFLGVRTSSVVQDVDLIKTVSLAGVVVDDVSRQPLAGISVRPMRNRYASGQRVLWPEGTSAVTESDGRFWFRALPPGAYFLELHSAADEERIEIRDAAVAKEPEPRTIYRRMRWPAGDEHAQPHVLNPGDSHELPDIRIAKGPVYAVWGSLREPDCDATGRYRVGAGRQFGTALLGLASAEASCGAHFLITNLAPGNYQVTATTMRGISPPRSAWELVSVTNRSVRRDLAPMAALRVQGRLKLPERFPEDLRPSVSLTPLQGGSLTAPSPDVAPDGTFQTVAMPGRVYRVRVLGLRPPYYASEVTYAGGGPELLTVTVGDDGGTLSGSVRERDIGIAGAVVLAVAWPVATGVDFPIVYFTPSGEGGSFTLQGLPPDQYKVLAVTRYAWDTELQKPGRLESIASTAKDAKLGARAAVNISLDLTPMVVLP